MKRQRAQKKAPEPLSHFLGLPCEVWQRVIWPQCGKGQGLPWASVSKAWRRLACGAIEHFSPHLLSFSKRLWNALTKTYLAQFTGLRSFFLDSENMRMASALPALASLTQLRTLRVGRGTRLKTGCLNQLTQLTALDVSYNYGCSVSSVTGLTQLRLLQADSADDTLLSQLPTLTSLTYLDISNARFYVEAATLKRLTHLQYLSVRYCPVDSYNFLTALDSLVFLDMDDCRGAINTAPPLLALTSLTALSLDNVAVATETILAMTQLRVLGVGDTLVGAPDCFSVDSLSAGVLTQLRHLDCLFYSGMVFANQTPRRVTELGLSTDNEIGRAMARFTQWRTPLPPHYFNISGSAVSVFMNEQ